MKYYRNFEEIQFIYHGDWSDPELIYKGISLNYWSVDSFLYDDYIDYFKNKNNFIDNKILDRLFKYHLIKNKNNILALIDDYIEDLKY